MGIQIIKLLKLVLMSLNSGSGLGSDLSPNFSYKSCPRKKFTQKAGGDAKSNLFS